MARGERAATRAEVLTALARLADEQVLWVGEEAPTRFATLRPRQVSDALGGAFDVVVLDLHDGLDADALGACHGLVWGGGALVLRMPPLDHRPRAPSLVVEPFTLDDVGARFVARFERVLARGPAAPLTPLAPPSRHVPGGTDEQARVVERLARAFVGPEPARLALLADRGRGKSSALGLALRDACARAPHLRTAITAARPEAAEEVLRFAPTTALFVSPSELVRRPPPLDVLVVDEAAQLPVSLLRALVERHPSARLAFATTVHGYEGTGRGFPLRFLAWARARPDGVPLTTLELREPIRWSEGDPLERLVFDALALDAEPAAARLEVRPPPRGLEAVVFDRDALASDERTLRELFGLLVHAHYRTTPSDLHRLLDAPNLAVHALLHGGQVVAASVVAREGGLSPERSEALARGRGRIRGHALADTLITHAGRPDAGALTMVRSVRIATHPAWRGRGLARRLVEHVHRTYAPDLFGTLFGATPELLRFRRALGYTLVRAGVSRGARTGEPTAVMIRPVSARARALEDALRVELAQGLPLQLELFEADGELGLDPALDAELRFGLASPPPLSPEARAAVVARYVGGTRPYESVAFALGPAVEEHVDRLSRLASRERRLVEGRVRQRRGWVEVAREAGYPSVAAAMRALRPTLRALLADPPRE